ncbi:MAG: hypothetical protein II240_01035 [Bacteroidaceae bacterium]|nr:hypothetical protein [Bacteroidaceae bacterium]
MKKYNVMGYEMVKVRDLRHTVRKLRRTVKERYNMFDAEKQAMIHLAYNDIVKQLYLEEFNKAKTPDEIRAVLEMPGDFVVYRPGKDRYDYTYFAGWDENGEAITTKKGFVCMFFEYESKAQEIAEQLGEPWKVLDASPEEQEDVKKLLNALTED